MFLKDGFINGEYYQELLPQVYDFYQEYTNENGILQIEDTIWKVLNDRRIGRKFKDVNLVEI